MNKLILLLLSLSLFSAQGLKSQGTAMDFTQNDCQGNEHQLYDELDAGKVVILDFIMLNCAPCIVATNSLEILVEPYTSSHPGRVEIYSFGFLNSYTCDQLNAWRTDNKYDHPVFNGGEQQVAYYGGMGMPTIVVVGTNEHKVFYNGIGYSSTQNDKIIAAVDSALMYSPSGIFEKDQSIPFRAYPTMFSDHIYIETTQESLGSELLIYDSFGRVVLSRQVGSVGTMSIDAWHLPSGIYFARLKSGTSVSRGARLIRL